MFQKYDISNAMDNIEIEVQMGTIGVATSSIYIAPPGGQNWQPMPELSSNNGNISRYILGIPQHLLGKYLLIQSLVDFSIIDESLWKSQLENLVLRYVFYGGSPNPMLLDFSRGDVISSKNGKIAVINTIILLS